MLFIFFIFLGAENQKCHGRESVIVNLNHKYYLLYNNCFHTMDPVDRVAQIDERLVVIDAREAVTTDIVLLRILAQERLVLTQERASLTTPPGK